MATRYFPKRSRHAVLLFVIVFLSLLKITSVLVKRYWPKPEPSSGDEQARRQEIIDYVCSKTMMYDGVELQPLWKRDAARGYAKLSRQLLFRDHMYIHPKDQILHCVAPEIPTVETSERMKQLINPDSNYWVTWGLDMEAPTIANFLHFFTKILVISHPLWTQIDEYLASEHEERALSFDDFIQQYLAEVEEQIIQPHVMWDMCQPCLGRYDFIIKTESAVADTRQLLLSLGVEPSKQRPTKAELRDVGEYLALLSKDTLDRYMRVHGRDITLFDYL